MVQSNYYKHYFPSLPSAIIATVVFALLTLAHGYGLFRTRKWFCIPALVGAIFEVVGFASRAQNSKETSNKALYIVQALTILLAPILIAATAYSFLGRLIIASGRQSYAIVRVSWITKIFVGGDVVCFIIQMAGSGLLVGASTESDYKTANDIVLAGLWLQIAIFILYIATAITFDVRLRKEGTIDLQSTYWKRLLILLYMISFLIISRNIYRAVEYTEGQNGYLVSHEWPVYALDALLMALALAIMLLWYRADLSTPVSKDAELALKSSSEQAMLQQV